MKKVFYLFLILGLTSSFAFAVDSTSRTNAKTCEKPNSCAYYTGSYAQRATVYNALNLTAQQVASKDAMEQKRFKELQALYLDLDQEQYVLNTLKVSDVSKTSLLKQQKVVRNIAHDIEKVDARYDREFVKSLTPEQRSKYYNIKRLDNREMKASYFANKKNYLEDKKLKKFGEK